MASATTQHARTNTRTQRGVSEPMTLSSDRVADQRTGHAVPTAAPLAQLEALDRDHLDACLTHLGDGVGVALVGHDDAGLERDHVVAVFPLLALLLVGAPAGLHHV